jgi:hypothetical protein
MKLLLFVLVCLSFLFNSCKENSNPAKTGLGTIYGYVYNAYTHEKISDAVIQTMPPTEVIQTDKNGYYKILNLNPGNYTITGTYGNLRNSIVVGVIADNDTRGILLLDTTSTINHPPNLPTNPSPKDKSERISNTMTLNWECSDPDGDALLYDVYAGNTNPPLQKVASKISSTSYDITLSDSGIYYWQVVAFDTYLAEIKSHVWEIDSLKKGAISDGLIAYWSFDDGTANDQSEHGYNGTLMNNPTLIDGKHGKAFQFVGYEANGSNGSHILLPNINFSSMNEFTISLWGRYESASSILGEFYIFWGNGTTNYLAIGTYITQGLSNMYIADIWSVGAQYNYSFSPSPIYRAYPSSDLNKWVHYCLVYKNNTIYAYRNGQLVDSKYQQVNIGTTSGSTHKGAIGRHWWNPGSGEVTCTNLNGSVDEVRIYNRALTDAEAQTLSQ